MIENAENLTRLNDKITVTIAINYGGRHEITSAIFRMCEDMRLRGLDPDMDRIENLFPKYLMTYDIPDPDLLIRTSEEKRISNFLIWQCAYTEFVFEDCLWPDFSKANLEAAIAEFKTRDRRYGGINASHSGRSDS